MLGVSPAFNKALVRVAGALAIKIGVVHVLTVRSRILTGDNASGRAGKWDEDSKAATWVATLLKYLTVAVGPTPNTQVGFPCMISRLNL